MRPEALPKRRWSSEQRGVTKEIGSVLVLEQKKGESLIEAEKKREPAEEPSRKAPSSGGKGSGKGSGSVCGTQAPATRAVHSPQLAFTPATRTPEPSPKKKRGPPSSSVPSTPAFLTNNSTSTLSESGGGESSQRLGTEEWPEGSGAGSWNRWKNRRNSSKNVGARQDASSSTTVALVPEGLRGA